MFLDGPTTLLMNKPVCEPVPFIPASLGLVAIIFNTFVHFFYLRQADQTTTKFGSTDSSTIPDNQLVFAKRNATEEEKARIRRSCRFGKLVNRLAPNKFLVVPSSNGPKSAG